MEYKAVYAVLSGDGIPPAKANILPQVISYLLTTGRLFFMEDEKDMFKKCPICSYLLKDHKKAFLGTKHTNFAMEAALADLLEDKGILRDNNRLFVDRHIRLAGIAGNQGLTCVRGSHAFFSDPDAICAHASVSILEVATLDEHVELP
jgi:hypothetical protein